MLGTAVAVLFIHPSSSRNRYCVLDHRRLIGIEFPMLNPNK